MRRLAWAALCLACGCSAAPENRYYLLAASPDAAAAATASPTEPGLRLAQVRLPDVLDRPQLVEGTGPQSVVLLENDRWAEPLPQMAPRVLGQDLAAAAALRPVARAARLDVQVDTFMAGPGGVVRLTGSWSEAPPNGGAQAGPVWRFAFSAPVDVTRGADVAAGMSALLGLLADQIADREGGGRTMRRDPTQAPAVRPAGQVPP